MRRGEEEKGGRRAGAGGRLTVGCLDFGDGVDTVVFEIVHVTSGRDAFWLDAAGLDPGIPLGLNERVGRSYAPMMKALKQALLLAPSVMRELGMIAEAGRG